MASRRSLPAEIAKFRNRALTAAGLSQVYGDPIRLLLHQGKVMFLQRIQNMVILPMQKPRVN
ncbi:hypothetical protein [Acaryochloris sp. CCMEE 5410]|uniref:hypothetical protein n=1 Tax=Acaryochloris sp. CCMEE 5410 TaxID=310037 RepID=UPI0021CE75DE|nr:hypothetical protein [Acaryochloris sp. CCMEE 5410]